MVEIFKKLNFRALTETYNCSNGLRINFSLVDDLVPDCGPDAEDEKLLENIKQNELHSCAKRDQFPCKIGHPRCFNIYDICKYRLNDMSHLIPCRSGEHLENCNDFECNMMFKCPSSYCIPWGYVCNSEWNCPSGFDELNSVCGSTRQCYNLYKCVQSQICIHLNDICNGVTDCPHKEDESYCSLNNVICPLTCKCLTYAIQCIKLNLNVDIFKKAFPFHVVSIEMSQNYSTLYFLKFFKFVTTLILVKNEIEQLCGKLPSFQYLFVLDAGFNNIKRITSYCIIDAYFLKILRLNNNKVSLIFSHAFVNLTSIQLIDLSQNLLYSFTSKMVINSCVRVLSLINNNIKIIELSNLKLDMLKINNYHFCCVMIKTAQCSAQMPWYISCADLLGNLKIKGFLYSTCGSIILFNIFTMASQMFLRTQKISGFDITVLSINITDIMYGFSLFILCVADSYFQRHFLLHAPEWKFSLTCLVVFTTVLSYNFSSSFLLSFLSLQRYMIVIYPLRTKFKEIKFIKSFIFWVFISIFFFSFAAALFTRYYYKLIPFHLCFPFLDPSKSVFVMKFFTWMTLIAHTCTIIFMLIVNLLTIKATQNTEINQQNIISKNRSHSTMIIQTIVFFISSIVCWIPCDITYMICIFLERYSIEIIIWIVVVVSPTKSIINPIIFTIIKFKK